MASHLTSSSSCSSAMTENKPTTFKRLKSKLVKLKKDIRKIPPEETIVLDSDTPNTTLDAMGTVATPSESVSVALGQSSQSLHEEDIMSPTGKESSSFPADLTCESPGVDESEHPQTEAAETLAHRIQTLLSAIPPGCTPSTLFNFGFSKGSNELPSDSSRESGSTESVLLSQLSSASTMNGSLLKGRNNAWGILERMSSKTQKTVEYNSTTSGDGTVEMTSVVISCPFQPTDDTEVEIARSDIVSILEVDKEAGAETSGEDISSKEVVWTWFPGKDKGKGKAPSTEKMDTRPATIKEVRIWYPSRTKISLEATWWGYRIYLPPPVMRVLSDKSLEAAKRAAMITTALSWLVKRIPVSMLPPQLKPVILVVRRIVPLLGYVGGFIAWSWTTVQGFDKGHGVILSATWLLPIALVPGTWFYTEMPLANNSDDREDYSPAPPPMPPPQDYLSRPVNAHP